MSQPLAFKPEKYIRKPFVVEAVEVTEENMQDVANWCRGQVRTFDASEGRGEKKYERYIKVPVKRALDEKQTRAYLGDWVLRAGAGFKVYTPKAFSAGFDKKVEDMLDVVERMVAREAAEDEAEKDQFDSTTPDSLPTGGRNTSFLSASG